MTTERKYGFRTELNKTHKTGLRDKKLRPSKSETEIKDGWTIAVAENAAAPVVNAAKDLSEFLFETMNVSAGVKRQNFSEIPETAGKMILIGTTEDFSGGGPVPPVTPGSYAADCAANRIAAAGRDPRGAAQAVFYLEDIMSLREAPFLPRGEVKREPVFSPRMIHSGWGMDQFPDSHLKAIARAGIDSVLLFAKDVDKTTIGYMDFNDLIERASSHGLDVYFYSYIKSLKHPSEKDAEEYYANSYGRLFKSCPGAKGVIFVGESCEFPSKDLEHTTGKPWNAVDHLSGHACANGAGLRQLKPSPGWWPCYDYPEWLNMMKKVIRSNSPSADIVFWTYNWGYAPEADRIKLIESIPSDVTLMATFEMFEPLEKEGATGVCSDYTISFAGPGKYFAGEAAAAKKRGIRLYTMSNTGGMTWDFGVVPYIPVPLQWAERNKALLSAHEKWGLSGLMDSHHYGFWPSEVSELAKWTFWTPSPAPERILRKIAERDYGKKAAAAVLKAWGLWSAAIKHYTPANEDQYGPFRVGPSYPLLFHPDITRTFLSQEIPMPSVPHAHFGSAIVKTFYHPYEMDGQPPGAKRYPADIKSLGKMRSKWLAGMASLKKAAELAANEPPHKRRNLERLTALGAFIAASVTTAINAKRWWLLNARLLLEKDSARISRVLDSLAEIAKEETENARSAIPAAESHSRLGWEPSMEYMTDKEHLDWKIKQLKIVLEHEIPLFRKISAI